jgi:ABC-type uncharacterized transport system YnjBCD ATPase subunit
VAQQVQTAAHEQIARVVTRCLRTVGYDYEFSIHFKRSRGRTEARLTFARSGAGRLAPLDACGGGAVDVAAFGLRLACLLLAVPKRRRLLVLDEPFKHVDRGRASLVRDLLLALARDLDVQLIFSTHNPDLVCGKVVQL